jgi:hypothetical protein
MNKVVLVFVLSAIILAVATVKAEGAVEARNAQETECVSVAKEEIATTDSVTYQIRFRMRDMNIRMHLGAEQIQNLQYTCNDLSRRVAQLEKYPVEQRQARLSAIVAENLAAVHELVNAEQYETYLAYMNEELDKAGLNVQ